MGLLDEYDLPHCARTAFAGGFIGVTCGFLFGSVEASKQARLTEDFSKIGSKLRDPVLMRFFFRNQLTTTAQFGAFYCVYQTVKCSLEAMDTEKPVAIAAASATSLVPFLPSRMFRRNLPWAVALIGMDIYSGGIKRN